MLTASRTFFGLFCAFLMLCASLACSTSRGKTADDPTAQTQARPADHEGAQDWFDPEVQRLVLAGPVPLVVKVHMQGVDQIAAGLEAVVETGMVGRGVAPQIAEYRKLGVVALMSSVVPAGDYVDQIDRKRPSYVMRKVLADDSYWTALRYGAIWQPAEVTPYAVHTRFLLPTAHPEKLAEAMGTTHGEGRDDMRAVVTPSKRFVIVDMVEFGRPVDRAAVMKEVTAETAQILERQRPDGQRPDGQSPDEPGPDELDTDLRKTPALVRFAQSDAPVSVYLRSEDFRLDSGAMGMFEAMQALDGAEPVSRMQMLARGGAVGLFALMMAPVSEIDHEDAVLEVRADDAGGIVLDATSTLTERGQKVAAAAASDRRVQNVPSASESASPFVSLRWNYDVPTMATRMPPAFWGKLNEARRFSRGMGAFDEMLRTGGWRGYAEMILVSPTFFARAGAASMPGQLESLFPIAGALEMRRSGSSSGLSPAEMDLAGAVLFGAARAKDAATPYLDQLRQMAKQMKVPVKLDFADSEADHPRLEVRAGAATAKGDTTREVSVDAGTIVAEAQLEPLIAQYAGAEAAKSLTDLTKVRLEWNQGSSVSRMRLHFGGGELATPPVADLDGFAPAKAGPLCVDTLAVRSLQIFGALESMNPARWGEHTDDLLDIYDTLARECAKEQPQLEEALKLARARMRTMLRMRASMVDNVAADAVLRKRACELGDEIQCE